MRERFENMVVVAYGAPVEVLALAGLLRDESIRYIIANNLQLPKGELELWVQKDDEQRSKALIEDRTN
jgi:hypothetical protein